MKYLLVLLFTIQGTVLLQSQDWNSYPYKPTDTEIEFPLDEGWHADIPNEWWYTTVQLVGETTGDTYTVMMSFFAVDTFGFDGFRIFNIANETKGSFKTGNQFLHYPSMSQDHLEFEAKKLDQTIDTWKTKRDSGGNLIPFEYSIDVKGAAGSIKLDYKLNKRPLIIGNTGYFDQGKSNYTYYYSFTGIEVTGTINYDGVEETVSGKAWFDKQYGKLTPEIEEVYEWFSLQLSNGMDLNFWQLFNVDKEVPDDYRYKMLNVYIDEDNTLTTLDFKLERLKYAYTDSKNCYANQWRLTQDSLGIDVVFKMNNHNSEVQSPFQFMEGGTNALGFVDGVKVTGKGFAELLHTYQNPRIIFSDETNAWSIGKSISWELLDKDEGRPIYYDFLISDDGKETFTSIAENLNSLNTDWDHTNYSKEKNYWFKIIGYSIDSLLKNEIITDKEFFLYPSGVEEMNGVLIKIQENPVHNQLKILSNKKGKARVISIDGNITLPIFYFSDSLNVLDVNGLKSGVYFLLLEIEGKNYLQKWIKG